MTTNGYAAVDRLLDLDDRISSEDRAWQEKAVQVAADHIRPRIEDDFEAITIAQSTRELLAGDGITGQHPVMRHMANLEAVRTSEGTDGIHALTIGRALTGVSAF